MLTIILGGDKLLIHAPFFMMVRPVLLCRDVEFTFQRGVMTERTAISSWSPQGTTIQSHCAVNRRIVRLTKPGKEDMLSLFSLPVFPERSAGKITNLATTRHASHLPVVRTALRHGKWGQNIVYSA
ncbi:hypothetical protein DMH88_15770 [Escherichia coli]|nr:hypothetical protein [Escherichia coli]